MGILSLDIPTLRQPSSIALQTLNQLNPDVITLDIEMPEMDGLETLKELRRLGRAVPVIMFNTLIERRAASTLNALFLGAKDYVTKPANVGSVKPPGRC